MKIVRQCTADHWEAEFTCDRCGTVLLLEEKDLGFVFIPFQLGCTHDPSYFIGADCPTCQVPIRLDEAKIPLRLRLRIQDKGRIFKLGDFGQLVPYKLGG